VGVPVGSIKDILNKMSSIQLAKTKKEKKRKR